MKEKLTKNLGLKAASLVLAFIVWLIVVNISNPEVTGTKTVQLEILNDYIITDAAKTYDILGSRTVSVSYSVRALDAPRIKASDFNASIDLQKLYSVTGAVPVDIEVVNNRDLIIGNPQAKPQTIKVSTEDIQRKSFKLSTHAIGEPAEGLAVGEIKLDPSSIYLNGPVSMIGQISSVGIEVDVEGASDDITGTAKPILYDANGNRLNIGDSRLVFDNEQVWYTATILRGKSLSLAFNVGGEPASGYRFTGAESSVKSIQVIGLSTALEGVSAVEIPPSVLNIAGATENKTIVLDLQEFLPEGISPAGNSQVSVTLKVEAVNKKNFELQLSDMAVLGSQPGYVYELVPETITVIASGPSEALQKMNAGDLNAKLNFTGLSEGRHRPELGVTPPQGIYIDSHTPFELVIFKEGERESDESREGVQQEEEDIDTESSKEENSTETLAPTKKSNLPTVPSKPEESSPQETGVQGTKPSSTEHGTGRHQTESGSAAKPSASGSKTPSINIRPSGTSAPETNTTTAPSG